MSERTMLAIRYHEFGGPDALKLERVARPQPREGEVLVRVVAAGVLPIDWKIRKGTFPAPVRLPAIPGTAFAGVIEEVGPGEARFSPGQEVFGRSVNGVYAEYTAASEDAIALKPASMSFEEAASLSGGATTAWRAIASAGVRAGDRVLVHGAAGGVGLFAVQFAKALGAEVAGTGSPSNLAFIRSLGADAAIDYTATRFEEVVRDVDFVLDTIGGDTLERSWTVLKRGGALVTIVGKPPVDRGNELDVRVLPSGLASAQDLADIAKLIEEGRAKAFVQRVFPLREAAQAHALSEGGHGQGRIVLRVAEEAKV